MILLLRTLVKCNSETHVRNVFIGVIAEIIFVFRSVYYIVVNVINIFGVSF